MKPTAPTLPESAAIESPATRAPSAPISPKWQRHFSGSVPAWLLAALAWACVMVLWQKLGTIQEQLARQSADSGQLSLEAKVWAKQAQETVTDNSSRLSLLEARVGEVAVQRGQLDELMVSLSRSRDDTVLMDVEISLRLAQQHMQHSGSAEPLLAALQSAQKRLQRSAVPRLAPVLRAIDKDVQRLQTVNTLDVTGLLQRLDTASAQLDAVVWASQAPVVRERTAAIAAPPLAPSLWGEWGARTVRQLTDPLWDLVRITRMNTPEALLLTPEQAYFLRENLRLKLLNVRLRLLSRHYDSARSELAQIEGAAHRYADAQSRPTAQWLQALALMQQQLSQAREWPRSDATLAAIEAISAGR